jgi:hypothetical protein
MSQPQQEVTEFLLAWSEGDKEALDELMPVVYDELRRLARWRINAKRSQSRIAGNNGPDRKQ